MLCELHLNKAIQNNRCTFFPLPVGIAPFPSPTEVRPWLCAPFPRGEMVGNVKGLKVSQAFVLQKPKPSAKLDELWR